MLAFSLWVCRYKRYIKPVLSMSIDFYIRVFVRVYSSAAEVKNAPCRLSYVWQSSGCDSFWLQPVGQKKVRLSPSCPAMFTDCLTQVCAKCCVLSPLPS